MDNKEVGRSRRSDPRYKKAESDRHHRLSRHARVVLAIGQLCQINIDNKQEYIIYHDSYDADRYGRPLASDSEKVKAGYCYDFGNIYFETAHKRYVIKRVCQAFDWVAELLDYIDNHKNEENIYIDMSRLKKSSDDDYLDFECGDCYAERI